MVEGEDGGEAFWEVVDVREVVDFWNEIIE